MNRFQHRVRHLDLLTKVKVPLTYLLPEHLKALSGSQRLSQKLVQRDRDLQQVTHITMSLRTGGSSPGDICVSSRSSHQLPNC